MSHPWRAALSSTPLWKPQTLQCKPNHTSMCVQCQFWSPHRQDTLESVTDYSTAVVLHIKCNRPLISVLYCCSKNQSVIVNTTIFWHSGQVLLGLQHWLRGPWPKIQLTTSMACSRITPNSCSASYALLLSDVQWHQHTMYQVRSSCHSLPWQEGSPKFKGLHKAPSERHSLAFCIVFTMHCDTIITM